MKFRITASLLLLFISASLIAQNRDISYMSSGGGLKSLFDFYLRTTKLPEIAIKQTGFNEYTIKSANLPMPLPIDVMTETGTKQITLTTGSVKVSSNFPPVADPKRYYLKTIIND
jgi:hypothetical protein